MWPPLVGTKQMLFFADLAKLAKSRSHLNRTTQMQEGNNACWSSSDYDPFKGKKDLL